MSFTGFNNGSASHCRRLLPKTCGAFSGLTGLLDPRPRKTSSVLKTPNLRLEQTQVFRVPQSLQPNDHASKRASVPVCTETKRLRSPRGFDVNLTSHVLPIGRCILLDPLRINGFRKRVGKMAAVAANDSICENTI